MAPQGTTGGPSEDVGSGCGLAPAACKSPHPEKFPPQMGVKVERGNSSPRPWDPLASPAPSAALPPPSPLSTSLGRGFRPTGRVAVAGAQGPRSPSPHLRRLTNLLPPRSVLTSPLVPSLGVFSVILPKYCTENIMRTV